MPGFYSVVSSLLILACYSAANLSHPQPLELFVQQHSSEQSASFSNSGFVPDIEELPWNGFVRSGQNMCSGMIIHQDWVLVRKACLDFHNANPSDIVLSVGGETPEKATQVLSAEIHQITDLLEGVTLLHLNGSLAFNKKVRPARIPFDPTGNINYFYGFTSGFANESKTFQLEAFQTTVFTSLCSDSESLCAFGIDWPQPDAKLAGVDFLGAPYMYADGLQECVLGARKSQLGSNFTSYYPLLNILPAIEKHLGLTVQPIPPIDPTVDQARCGILQ